MRNKKTKSDYYKKRQLLTSYDFYKAKHKKLPVSEEEYQELKDEILILESRYPSIKKMGDDLVIRATLNYPDGRIYKGAIKSAEHQIPHGHGFMSLNNGKLDWDYIGEFKDGVFDGEGEFVSKGYYSYKGKWKKSCFHGKGIYKNEETNEVYEGDFIENNRHGYGVLNVNNEHIYEGEWKNNDGHGKSKVTFLKDIGKYQKGTVIIGNFKKGEQHGEMKTIFPDGEILYSLVDNGKTLKVKWHDEKKWRIPAKK